MRCTNIKSYIELRLLVKYWAWLLALSQWLNGWKNQGNQDLYVVISYPRFSTVLKGFLFGIFASIVCLVRLSNRPWHLVWLNAQPSQPSAEKPSAAAQLSFSPTVSLVGRSLVYTNHGNRDSLRQRISLKSLSSVVSGIFKEEDYLNNSVSTSCLPFYTVSDSLI